MNSYPILSLSATRGASRATRFHSLPLVMALAVTLAVPALRANPTGVSADLSGVLTWPNHGPDSIANQSQEVFTDHTGTILGAGTATAQINATRSGYDLGGGPDIVGSSGTTTLSATSTAQLGHLEATAGVSATSQPGPHWVYFPHGDAQVNVGGPPVARFDDTTTVFNSNYALGTLISVSLTLDLNWGFAYDLGTTGYNFAENGATAILAVDGIGNVSAYDLMRTDSSPVLVALSGPQTLTFNVANGGTFTWETYLTVFSEVALGGLYQDFDFSTYPDVAASAFSHASIDVTPTSGLDGTVFTSDSGFVYGQQTVVPGVPDSGCTALLLGFGLAATQLVRRRRKMS